ncbi:MAG TPA: hypothetical protein VJH94_01760 [Candidatus Paceibacterota bacterium]
MKATIISVCIALALIAGSLLFSGGGSPDGSPSDSGTSVLVDGTQVIEIIARGGYSPRIIRAKAGIPLVIKMKTQSTFDCSSALSIPSIGYRANLPSSGITDIEVPAQETGFVLQGLCAMGMYRFQVVFD